MMKCPFWLTVGWWKYIFQPVGADEGFKFRLRVYLCRWRGHPYGVIFYNPSGLESDMTCRNCGDDLG